MLEQEDPIFIMYSTVLNELQMNRQSDQIIHKQLIDKINHELAN